MEKKKSTFYTIIHELSKSFENLTFSLKRAIDLQNIQILLIYQHHLYSISPEMNEKARQVLVTLNKARITQTIHSYLQSLIKDASEASSKTLETLYWLLKKYDVHQYITLFESAVQSFYGEAKQFGNAPSDLEKVFDLPFNERSSNLKEYITFIEGLYLANGEIEIEKIDAEEDILDTTAKESEVEEEAKVSSASGKVVLKPSGGNLVNIEKTIDPHQDVYWFMGKYLTEGDPESHLKLTEGTHFALGSEFEFVKNGSGKFKGSLGDFFTYKKEVLKSKKEHFKDDDFLPEMETITPDYKAKPKLREVSWHRIGETTKSKLLLCGTISPNDIVQGRLGDCYFLSALSALAEKKNLIERLFVTRKASTTGIYSVWLCDSGEWKNVIVDDYFPCNTAGKKRPGPRFARCKNDDIWVLVLEKAFAKLYGTYYAIGGGYLEEALSCLTGASIKYLRPKGKAKEETLEEIWKFLTKSTEKGFVVTAASRKESKSVNNKAMGLASGHGYAVLDAKEVTKGDGKKEKLVKMRNPWGTLEWKGEWRDNCENWTPELLSSVGYTPKSMDGVFWMNLSDFEKYFYNFCCCEVYDDFKYSFIKLGEGKRQRAFACKLKVGATGGMSYIGVQQKRKKYFEGNPAYIYSYVRVILMKIEEGSQKKRFIPGKYKHAQTIVIREELEAGAEYLVFVEVDWMQSFYNEIVVTSYSGERIEIKEEIIDNIRGLYEEIVKGLMEKAEKTGKVKETKVKGIKAEKIIKLEYENKIGLIVNFLKNKEKGADVFYSLRSKNPEIMEILIPKESEWPVVQEHLKEGEKKLIAIKLKRKHLKNQAVSLGCQENVVVVEKLTKEKMIEACKSKGKKLLPLKENTVEMYTLKFEGGMLVYYVNKGERTLQDKVSVDSKNVVINGEEKDFIEVLVKPGEEFLLEIRVNDVFGETKFHKESKVKQLK